MKIGENTFVALSYELKVGGEPIEKVTAEAPLQFVYGAGQLLPAFEKEITGLKKGEKFKFKLPAEQAYGEVIPEAVVDLSKDLFMIDGKIEEGLLEVGNQLPMSDNQGNRLVGTIRAIGDSTVTMDFNHPLAGQELEFSGDVVEVRQSTPEDMMQGMGSCGGGCDDCGDSCEADSGCGCGCDA